MWVREKCSMVQWERRVWRLLHLGSLPGFLPARNPTLPLLSASALLQSLSHGPPNPAQLSLFSMDLHLSPLWGEMGWRKQAEGERKLPGKWEFPGWRKEKDVCRQWIPTSGLLCVWIKINTHTHLTTVPSMQCVPEQTAHLIVCKRDTLASADRRPRGRLRLHLGPWWPQQSHSSAQTGLSLGQPGQQSFPFLWDWLGIERAVRKITPKREWWGWGPLGGGEKMMRDQSKVRKSISFSLQIYKFRGL